MRKVNETPPEHLDHLKRIKVRSEAVEYTENVKIESEESREEAKRLPSSRLPPNTWEMGVKDPDKVPVGKISLREAVDMVKAHAIDQESYNVKYLAEFHNMNEEDVFHVLDRFKAFNSYIPVEKWEKKAVPPLHSYEKIENATLDLIPWIQKERFAKDDAKKAAYAKWLEERKKYKAKKVHMDLLEESGLKRQPHAVEGEEERTPESIEPPADSSPTKNKSDAN